MKAFFKDVVTLLALLGGIVLGAYSHKYTQPAEAQEKVGEVRTLLQTRVEEGGENYWARMRELVREECR